MSKTFPTKILFLPIVFAVVLISSSLYAEEPQYFWAPEEYIPMGTAPAQSSANSVQQPAAPSAPAPSQYNEPAQTTKIPYAAPSVSKQQPKSFRDLTTQSGLDLALQLSDYKYREPKLDVTLKGAKVGFNAIATGTLPYNYFIAADIRLAVGPSDYSSPSGVKGGRSEELWDIRALVGKDYPLHTFDLSYTLSPFVGIAYRYLYSDDRGQTNLGFDGYERANNLYYIPLGVKPQLQVTSDAVIKTTFEYDAVIQGDEVTSLSDVHGYPNVDNKQNGGYGLRTDAMWQESDWSAGPFLIYWDIDSSNTVCAAGSLYYVCGKEPNNHTLEYGLQFRYHFF